MLGSIQIKRGELKEAMQIYELALSDTPVVFSGAVDEDEIDEYLGYTRKVMAPQEKILKLLVIRQVLLGSIL